MAENSAIEWTDHTFNPWVGCQKVSPGCDHCYAETLMDHRWKRVEWGPDGERVRTKNWSGPRKWNREAGERGERARVFCASLADVFDNKAPEGAREDLWQLISETPNLDWLLLTKRPQNMESMLPSNWGDHGWANVWLGVSAENQTEADRRLPILISTPARIRFVSAEPLLGPIDFAPHLDRGDWNPLLDWGPPDSPIHWIITGGESGAGFRPMDSQWVRDIRDLCVREGVSFFHKQGASLKPAQDRVLDGRTWDEVPSAG